MMADQSSEPRAPEAFVNGIVEMFGNLSSLAGTVGNFKLLHFGMSYRLLCDIPPVCLKCEPPPPVTLNSIPQILTVAWGDFSDVFSDLFFYSRLAKNTSIWIPFALFYTCFALGLLGLVLDFKRKLSQNYKYCVNLTLFLSIVFCLFSVVIPPVGLATEMFGIAIILILYHRYPTKMTKTIWTRNPPFIRFESLTAPEAADRFRYVSYIFIGMIAFKFEGYLLVDPKRLFVVGIFTLCIGAVIIQYIENLPGELTLPKVSCEKVDYQIRSSLLLLCLVTPLFIRNPDLVPLELYKALYAPVIGLGILCLELGSALLLIALSWYHQCSICVSIVNVLYRSYALISYTEMMLTIISAFILRLLKIYGNTNTHERLNPNLLTIEMPIIEDHFHYVFRVPSMVRSPPTSTVNNLGYDWLISARHFLHYYKQNLGAFYRFQQLLMAKYAIDVQQSPTFNESEDQIAFLVCLSDCQEEEPSDAVERSTSSDDNDDDANISSQNNSSDKDSQPSVDCSNEKGDALDTGVEQDILVACSPPQNDEPSSEQPPDLAASISSSRGAEENPVQKAVLRPSVENKVRQSNCMVLLNLPEKKKVNAANAVREFLASRLSLPNIKVLKAYREGHWAPYRARAMVFTVRPDACALILANVKKLKKSQQFIRRDKNELLKIHQAHIAQAVREKKVVKWLGNQLFVGDTLIADAMRLEDHLEQQQQAA